jgi:hypothetical protein
MKTKALALCHSANFDSNHRDVKISTYAVLFFGTPHSGARGVELVHWMGRLLSVYMYTNDTVLKALYHDSDELERIQKLYSNASQGIKSIFFFEQYPTPIMGGITKLVSQLDSYFVRSLISG